MSDNDLKILRNPGEDLADNHIDAALRLLRRDFPHVAGLDDPVVGQCLSYPQGQYSGQNYVQILNDGAAHWVTLQGESGNSVNLYDSAFDYAEIGTKEQVASILQHTGTNIDIKQKPVVPQTGDHDCGLFAVAYATEIASGGDPTTIKYDQKALRGHFESCLTNQKMTPFPGSGHNNRKAIISDQTEICLACHLPFRDGTDIMCNNCNVRYHISCENVSDAVCSRNKTHQDWKCSNCP